MIMRTPRSRASLALLTATLVAAGCQAGDGPNAPVALRCPTARVPLCIDGAHATLVRAAVADAETRVVPALESESARAALAPALTELSSRLADGDITGSLAALRAARAALAESREELVRHPVDAADLAGIELMLTETASALAAS